MCIPTDKVHFEEIRFRGEPHRGLFCGTRKPSHLVEPHCDGSMTIDRNRDIDVLGDNKAGSCVGFEQVRDLRTRNHDSGLLEDRRDSAKRSQKTCSKVHCCFGVYAPSIREATGSREALSPCFGLATGHPCGVSSESERHQSMNRAIRIAVIFALLGAAKAVQGHTSWPDPVPIGYLEVW